MYADEMALIENFKIDGKPLIELINDIKEIGMSGLMGL